MEEPVIVDCVRTPIGKKNGKLSGVRADQMVVHLLNSLLERTKIEPKMVEDVIVGCNTPIGECALDVARTSVLASNFPYDVPGVTLNRQCASGMQSLHFAAMEIATGYGDIVIAGGVEKQSLYAIGMDAMFPQPTPPHPNIAKKYKFRDQGSSAELIAQKYNLGREAMDQFALWSHQKAARAIREGRFKREIVPIEAPQKEGPPIVVDTDENVRPDTTLEKMAALKPVFKVGGSVTAGNSCPINDGSCLVMLASRRVAEELGLRPRARFRSMAVVGVDPVTMLLGPAPAMKKALRRAEMTLDQMQLMEVNEAFSSVVLAAGADLGLDYSRDPRLNVNGGAIALGHPTACSGARLVTTMLHEMERTSLRYGIASLCVGFGMGIATVVERPG
ncbi:MAG: thiolase family protein [Euryarchaeota archaeon]|nr:thiolase family protein [Euryarchaeota archaeon]